MAKKKTIRTIPQDRTPMREQPPAARVKNFTEVACGYSLEEALRESERCLMCTGQPCVDGCPVGIDIPGFILKINQKDFRGAYDVLTDTNLLPAICGRVCRCRNRQAPRARAGAGLPAAEAGEAAAAGGDGEASRSVKLMFSGGVLPLSGEGADALTGGRRCGRFPPAFSHPHKGPTALLSRSVQKENR